MELTTFQYSLVYNMMSLTIAAFLGSFVFFIFGRKYVGEQYQKAVLTSAVVVGIAAYHYFRIAHSWAGAFANEGETFNDAYRYADWLITVPLLLVELVLVMNLQKEKAKRLMTILVVSAVLMLLTGYFGEIRVDDTSLLSLRGFWGTVSSVFFVIILWQLIQEIWGAAQRESGQVRILVRNILLLTVFVWGFYPIVYMAPFYGLGGANGQVFLQVGYSLADIIAKAGYGLMIYAIAREKTLRDQGEIAE